MISTYYYGPQTQPHNNVAIEDFVSAGVFGEAGRIKDYCSMAVVEKDCLIAGTIYHNWHPDEGTIELTSFSLSKRWLTRKVIYAMFDLPFARLGCQLVILRVSEKNANMLGIARKFGFSETYIPRLRGREEGEFVFCLTDDQWAASPYNKVSPNG